MYLFLAYTGFIIVKYHFLNFILLILFIDQIY